MAAFIVSSVDFWRHAKAGVARPLSALPPVPSVLTASIGEDTAIATTSRTFEPIMDTYAFAGFASILLLSIAAVYVWATQVVPVSRMNLATSKKSGAIKEYLDELRAGMSSDMASNYAALNATDISMSPTNETTPQTSDGRDFERWLFTDWLEKSAAKGGRQKEPALPILKDAKWNSGDNPVLAASALIGACVLATSILERIASLFQ